MDVYPTFSLAVAHLAARGHSLDVWVAHLQLDEVAEIASAFPGLTIVVDHFGRPTLVGPFNGRAGEVLDDWPCAIERQGADENIFLKLAHCPCAGLIVRIQIFPLVPTI